MNEDVAHIVRTLFSKFNIETKVGIKPEWYY